MLANRIQIWKADAARQLAADGAEDSTLREGLAWTIAFYREHQEPYW